MKSYEWDARDRRLIEVNDPCYQPGASDHSQCIREAGYYPELNSGGGFDTGGSIIVFRNLAPGPSLPEYYIDLWGDNTNLGTFVARDFTSLIETLRYLEPLMKVMQLDQLSSARVIDQLSAERQTRHLA